MLPCDIASANAVWPRQLAWTPTAAAAALPPQCPLEVPLPLACCLLRQTCYKPATEPRFSTQRDHSAQTARLTRLGRSACSGSGFAPSRCVSGMWALPPCLSCAPPARHPQQCCLSRLCVPSSPSCSFVQALLGQTLSYRQPRPLGWAGGRSILVGCYPLAPRGEISPMGWEWRQPLPSDRFASAVLSWFVLPWPPGQCRKPAITNP